MKLTLEQILRNLGIPDRSFVENQIRTYSVTSSLNNFISKDNVVGISDNLTHGVDVPIVVSLTTYSKRIFDVHLVIESIFQQTLKPNRIILWLDEKEFSDESIPFVLKLQQKRGLTIKYCKNIKSFKKLIPSLKLYPNDIIITIDDDTIYPCDLIERLIKSYQKAPKCIHYTRGALMTLDGNGQPLPYKKWNRLADYTPMEKWSAFPELIKGTPLALPTGVGGVLYPPHSLHEDVMREDLFMKLCPQADDIWFKIMSYKQGTIPKLVYMEKPFSEKFLSIPGSQDIALAWKNLKNSANDPQMKNVIDYYNISFNAYI